MRSADDPPRFAPAKAPDTVTVKSLLDGVHCFEEHETGCRGGAAQPAIQAVESRIDAAISQALGAMTLRELAAALDDPKAVGREDQGEDAAPGALRSMVSTTALPAGNTDCLQSTAGACAYSDDSRR